MTFLPGTFKRRMNDHIHMHGEGRDLRQDRQILITSRKILTTLAPHLVLTYHKMEGVGFDKEVPAVSGNRKFTADKSVQLTDRLTQIIEYPKLVEEKPKLVL